MSDVQSGIFSNAYSYEPMVDEESFSRELLQFLGGAGGAWYGEEKAGPMGAIAGEEIGKQAGDLLGYYFNNCERIFSNVKTVGAEVQDWRSIDATMRSWSGASWGPAPVELGY